MNVGRVCCDRTLICCLLFADYPDYSQTYGNYDGTAIKEEDEEKYRPDKDANGAYDNYGENY